MDDNPYEAPQEPHVDPELGTERQPTIGGWGDRFMTRVALAVIVLLWVVFLGWVVFRLMRG
jgi:hypothetical protein